MVRHLAKNCIGKFNTVDHQIPASLQSRTSGLPSDRVAFNAFGHLGLLHLWAERGGTDRSKVQQAFLRLVFVFAPAFEVFT